MLPYSFRMIAIYPEPHKQADRTVAVASATYATNKGTGGLTGLTDGSSLCQRGRVGTWVTTQRRRPSQNIREFSIGWSVCWLAHTPTGAPAVCPVLPDVRSLLTSCSKSGRRLTDQRRQQCRRSNTHTHLAPDVKGTEAPQKGRLQGPVLPPESWTIPVNQKKRRKNEWALEYMGRVGAIGSSELC